MALYRKKSFGLDLDAQIDRMCEAINGAPGSGSSTTNVVISGGGSGTGSGGTGTGSAQDTPVTGVIANTSGTVIDAGHLLGWNASQRLAKASSTVLASMVALGSAPPGGRLRVAFLGSVEVRLESASAAASAKAGDPCWRSNTTAGTASNALPQSNLRQFLGQFQGAKNPATGLVPVVFIPNYQAQA